MSYIATNIKTLRKQAGYTQEQFAEKVGVKRSLIGAYEEGRAEPRLQTLSSIAAVLEVSTDALIQQDLSGGNVPAAHKSVKVLSITVDEADRENIELVPQKAAAGYLNGYADPEFIAELPKFRLPTLPSNATYRAFEIQGDSMLPLLSGTIIIGRYVEQVRDIKNGKTYVLVTPEEGVVYKRVFNYLDDRGTLYLVSDNKSYSAYEVKGDSIEEIWEAKAYISIQFPDPEAAEEVSVERLTGLVKEISSDVKEIKEKLPYND